MDTRGVGTSKMGGTDDAHKVTMHADVIFVMHTCLNSSACMNSKNVLV